MLKLFIRNRRGLLLVILAGLAAGLLLVQRMPIKLYPNTMKPIIGISISHPGSTAMDFQEQYGRIIDGALSSIRDQERVQINFQNSRTTVRIDYKWNVSYDEARIRAENAMSGIKGALPRESQDFGVYNWTGENSGFLAIAVTSREMEPEALYTLLEASLKPKLDQAGEAESIEMVNIRELRAEVELDQERLLNRGLPVDEVIQAVRGGYKPQPVGSFSAGRDRFDVRLKKGIDSVFDVGNIVIREEAGRDILLKDIADVDIRYDLPSNLFRNNGTRSIMIFATPKKDGNIKKMSEEIRSTIEAVSSDLPDHVRFDYLVDPAEFINKAIRNVIRSALIGAALAVLCVLILLGELRNTLLIAFSIPLSVVLGFILMYFFDLSINIISLGGITLSVGMIIDSSIVVMENIHRHRYESLVSGGAADPKNEAGLRRLILDSVGEVRGAIIASTLTSILVFLPLSFTAPLANAILGDLARAVIFTLACSLLVALLVVPVLAYYLFRRSFVSGREGRGSLARMSDSLMKNLQSTYRFLLIRLLKSRVASLIFIFAAFGILAFAAVTLLPEIRTEIIASPESDKIVLWVMKYDSESKEEMLEAIAPLEEEIMNSYGEKVTGLFAQVPRQNSASFIISLASSRYTEEIQADLEERYQSSTEWRYNIMPWDPSELPLPRTVSLHLKVSGPDKKEIMFLAEKAADIIRRGDLYRNVWTDPSTQPSNELILSRREAVPGIYSTSRLLSMAGTLLNGASAIEMNHEGRKVDVRISFPEGTISSLEDFANFLIPYQGRAIPFKHFFDIGREEGVSEVVTENGEETFNIFAIMKQEDPQSMQKSLEEKVRSLVAEEMEIPTGYALTFENAMEEYDRNVESLITALIASLVLVYILLGIQFNSLRVPLIILITVPMGFIGVLLSLYLFDSTLSLNSLLGTILLGGIVVNNAIIMIDFYFRRMKEGEERIDALADAAVLRFPPIIITMLTTVLGMLPIALALGDGTNIIQPLGIAVSGGLLVSTLFTLFMIPAVLNLFKVGGGVRLDHQTGSEIGEEKSSIRAIEGNSHEE